MTVVKYAPEALALWKADENLLDVFKRNYLRIILRILLTDRISNSSSTKSVVQSRFLGL